MTSRRAKKNHNLNFQKKIIYFLSEKILSKILSMFTKKEKKYNGKLTGNIDLTCKLAESEFFKVEQISYKLDGNYSIPKINIRDSNFTNEMDSEVIKNLDYKKIENELRQNDFVVNDLQKKIEKSNRSAGIVDFFYATIDKKLKKKLQGINSENWNEIQNVELHYDVSLRITKQKKGDYSVGFDIFIKDIKNVESDSNTKKRNRDDVGFDNEDTTKKRNINDGGFDNEDSLQKIKKKFNELQSFHLKSQQVILEINQLIFDLGNN